MTSRIPSVDLVYRNHEYSLFYLRLLLPTSFHQFPLKISKYWQKTQTSTAIRANRESMLVVGLNPQLHIQKHFQWRNQVYESLNRSATSLRGSPFCTEGDRNGGRRWGQGNILLLLKDYTAIQVYQGLYHNCQSQKLMSSYRSCKSQLQ